MQSLLYGLPCWVEVHVYSMQCLIHTCIFLEGLCEDNACQFIRKLYEGTRQSKSARLSKMNTIFTLFWLEGISL